MFTNITCTTSFFKAAALTSGLLWTIPLSAQQPSEGIEDVLTANQCLPEVWDALQAESEKGRQQYVSNSLLEQPRRIEEVTCVIDIFSDRLGGFINLPSTNEILEAIQNGVCRVARRYVGEADRVVRDAAQYSVNIPGVTLPGNVRLPGASGGTRSSPGFRVNNRSVYINQLYGPRKTTDTKEEGGS